MKTKKEQNRGKSSNKKLATQEENSPKTKEVKLEINNPANSQAKQTSKQDNEAKKQESSPKWEKDQYTEITKILTAKKINYGSARATNEGVEMNPPINEDYTVIVRTISVQKIWYYTYQTEEEKTLKVTSILHMVPIYDYDYNSILHIVPPGHYMQNVIQKIA